MTTIDIPILLHKILPLVALPLGLGLFCLALAFLFRSRFWAMLALAVLYGCSTPSVSRWLVRSLENRAEQVTADACPAADGILVLGGIADATRSSASRIEWSGGVDRFEAGLALHQAAKAPLLAFTGGKLPWVTQDGTEGDMLAAEAARRGVPRAALAVTGPCANTAEEAQRLIELNRQHRVQRVILVTSAMHMARARYIFEQAGFDVVPFPTDYRAPLDARMAATPLDWMPDASHLADSQAAVREWYGLIYYWTFAKKP